MFRLSYIISLLLACTTLCRGDPAPGNVTQDKDPKRYTSCAILGDQGYTLDNAIIAQNFVLQNLIPETGRHITTNYCYYKVFNATVAGVCNGSARDRTVTLGEVSRGFSQIQKDCGTDSGYHVVNNLTFSAYGLIGGIKALVPKEFAYPDFPGWSDEPQVVPVKK